MTQPWPEPTPELQQELSFRLSLLRLVTEPHPGPERRDEMSQQIEEMARVAVPERPQK